MTYRYDALGRRVARVQGAQITQYLYGDPGNPLRVTATRSAAGRPDHLPLRRRRLRSYAFERSGARFFVGTDQVGSPRVVTNAGGVVQDVRDYDAFGNLVSDSPPAFDLPIGYAGGLEDRVTGLVRFGFRDLDTASGPLDGARPRALRRRPGEPLQLRRRRPGVAARPAGPVVRRRLGLRGRGRRRDDLPHRRGLGRVLRGRHRVRRGGRPGQRRSCPDDGASIVAEAKANIAASGSASAPSSTTAARSAPPARSTRVVNVNIEDGTLQLENPVMDRLVGQTGLKFWKRL